MLIQPDLEVWLVSDPELSSQWRQLASLLSLTSAIPRLEFSRRRLRLDSEKVAELLRLWRSTSPHSYTVQRLLSVLDMMVGSETLRHRLSSYRRLCAGHEDTVRVGGADDQGQTKPGGRGAVREQVQQSPRHVPGLLLPGTLQASLCTH